MRLPTSLYMLRSSYPCTASARANPSAHTSPIQYPPLAPAATLNHCASWFIFFTFAVVERGAEPQHRQCCPPLREAWEKPTLPFPLLERGRRADTASQQLWQREFLGARLLLLVLPRWDVTKAGSIPTRRRRLAIKRKPMFNNHARRHRQSICRHNHRCPS